ncbi:MAG: phage/plasmid primase, P4 family, partial [Rhodospirillaceae bacterium]
VTQMVARSYTTSWDAIFAEGEFWYFSGSHWKMIERRSKLRRLVHRYDNVSYDRGNRTVELSRAKIDGIINEIGTLLYEPDFFANAEIGINCASGFIRYDAAGSPTLEPHSPDHRCRHVLPGAWPSEISDDIVRASLLARLLRGSFLGEEDASAKIDLLAELAGAAALGISTRLMKPRAIVLKGETAENGKSQVLDLYRGVLPASAVSSVPMHKFGDEKYILRMVGKHLNSSDELTSAAAISSEVFKSLVTGEPVTGRDVYRSAVEFRSIALNVFATNDLPGFRGGMDRGVMRRLLVIPFNRVIPSEERIEGIGRRIAAEEPDLLLDWTVQGASRLIRRGGFDEPESCKSALKNWCLSSDPVQSWLETVETGENVGRVPTSVAHQAFRDWAIAEGYQRDTLPAVNNFVQRVMSQRSVVRRIRPGNVSTLVGIRVPTPRPLAGHGSGF